MKHYLRKWLKSPGMEDDDFDIRNVLDWDYYIERLNNTIRKIITIPAALQKVPNPVPRVPHPDWLQTTVRRMNDKRKQKSIKSMFGVKKPVLGDMEESSQRTASSLVDMEDFGGRSAAAGGPGRPVVHSRRRRALPQSSPGAVPTTDSAEAGTAASPAMAGGAAVTPEKEVRVRLSNETVPEWLTQKKALWRKQRKDRRAKRAAESSQLAKVNSSDPKKQKTKSGLGSMEGYVRNAAEALKTSEWHVLEVRDLSSDGTSSDGTLQVWAMVGNGSLQRIRIKLPRTVYVDSRVELKQGLIGQLLVKRVERHRELSFPPSFLYFILNSSDNTFCE